MEGSHLKKRLKFRRFFVDQDIEPCGLVRVCMGGTLLRYRFHSYSETSYRAP